MAYPVAVDGGGGSCYCDGCDKLTYFSWHVTYSDWTHKSLCSLCCPELP